MSQHTQCYFFRKMATLLGLLIAVTTLFVVSNEAPAAHAQTRIASYTYVGVLPVGDRLNVNDTVVSPDGIYVLRLQNDGNLVEFKKGYELWASNSTGFGTGVSYDADMQGDGNFVIYCHGGGCGSTRHIYSTCTNGHSGSHLEVQYDGNVVVYDLNHKAIWARTWNHHCL